MVEWILSHATDIGFCLLIANAVAAATPPELKIAGIAVGKYDDVLVRGLRKVFFGFLKRD